MTWIQRDGTPIEVRAMSDRHLDAAIAMVRRKNRGRRLYLSMREAIRAFHYAETAPDGAAMAAEEAGRSYMTEEGMDKLFAAEHPRFMELLEERCRRDGSACLDGVEDADDGRYGGYYA